MPLVYAGLVPHSPLLIPTVGREHLSQLTKTAEAYMAITEDLYVVHPDTIIIISPHGSVRNSSFLINLAPTYTGNLEKFGDYSTRGEFTGDVGLCYKIRENLETSQPLQLITDTNLDYGTFIPLQILFGTQLNKPQIIPIYDAEQSLQEHFNFGKSLQREISLASKKIAVIVSGDLSHRLAQNSPGGYSPKAEKFDNKLVEFLQKNKSQEVLSLSPELIAEAGECGLKPIAILLGIIDGINVEPVKLAYEAPFGIGYLTMKYKL